ncbi:hypothetical protein QR680_010126 [Steinernema hermaphroditum]|uniref:Uncharacterized protein n=1 Tax=Steinernema hermaphroditum TaxID=289476 RepID=A0AA39IMU8_9BILA|nr:hypothetical protein QR680_010126 [Steinernema hermaphroditum]
MENYLFDTLQYRRLYNCSFFPHEKWSSFATPRAALGSICISIGVVNMISYIPCLFVIRKSAFMKYSSFKIMFFLGIFETTAILFNSFLTGYLHITGTVFCLAPNLQYISGCILGGCWYGSCFGCALLAINRCIDFTFPKVSLFLFDENRTFVWIALMHIYALLSFFFVPPVTLNSESIMWTFDPFDIFPHDMIPVDHKDYVSKINDYSNRVILGLMVISYLTLIIGIAVKGKGAHWSKTQTQVFTVAALICGLNFVPGFIFFLLETIPSTSPIQYVCLFTWLLGDGGGGVILLLFNKSIRSEVVDLLKSFRSGTKVVYPSRNSAPHGHD